MNRLHTLATLLLAHQLITWTSGLAIAHDVIQTPTELLKDWITRSLLQTRTTPGICPETEYYCGPGDVFEQEVNVALNQPKNCSFDKGILRAPTTRTLKKQRLHLQAFHTCNFQQVQPMQMSSCGSVETLSSPTAPINCTASTMPHAKRPV